MRILVALPPFEVFSPQNGGAVSTVTAGLARAWAEFGHEVHVTTPDAREMHWADHVHVIPYPTTHPRRHPKRLLAAAEGRLRRFDWPAYRLYVEAVRLVAEHVAPDRFVSHNDLVLPALMPAALRNRTLMHLHNDVIAKHERRAQRVLSEVHGSVAVSDYIAGQVRERYKAANVRTIHNGVELAAFATAHTTRRPGAPLRVAFLGRLLADKGPHVLLAAAERLAQEGLATQLTVIGSPQFRRPTNPRQDPYVREVADRVQALGGTYVPHLDRTAVALELSRQDVLVVPSLFPDPFALVVLEAMAAGCAVVASRTGGVPEAVGTAGLLFPVGDAEALADHLRALAADPVLLARLVTAGHERATAQNWSHVARQWTPLLEGAP